MHDYNASNDSFHFSVSVIQLELTGFLACHFFVIFIRKLTQMLILTLFSRTLDGLTEKRKTLCCFSIKIRISIFFMQLQSKLTSEMYRKIGGFDGKTEQNRLKVYPLFHLFFFFKKLLYLLKYEKH